MNSPLLPKLSHGVRRIGEVVGILAKYGLADWLGGTERQRSKQFFVGRDGVVLAHDSPAPPFTARAAAKMAAHAG